MTEPVSEAVLFNEVDMVNEETDILISRVIDRRATPEDWARLESLASRNSSVWNELALSIKLDQALGAEVSREASRCEHINITVERVVKHAGEFKRSGINARRIGSWAGWVAAAVLVMFSLRGSERDVARRESSVAGISGSPRELLSRYLSSGQRDGSVVGEVPEKVLLNTAPAEDGGTYVIFIRQIVEKVKVDDLYRISTDESGRQLPIRIPEAPTNGPAM